MAERHIYVHDHRQRARDHWTTNSRLEGGYVLLEGAGTDGGQWALKGPKGNIVCKGSKDHCMAEYRGASGE